MLPSLEHPLEEVCHCLFSRAALGLSRLTIIWLLPQIDFIEVALDVSANGRLQLPPYPEDSRSMIYNISIFMSSYETGRNFTITNGTASANDASLGDIMFQEPGSTVKHVKWTWPDCLVGDGKPEQGLGDTDRGFYNVSYPSPPLSPPPSLSTAVRHLRTKRYTTHPQG